MNQTRIVLLAGCLAAALAAKPAEATKVNVSLNAFPTTLANPNGGGTWTVVAKTDSTIGIAAINLYLKNIDQAGITMENDIATILNNGNAYVTPISGGLNVLYGQDTSIGPLVFGVGTLAKSDGPDPLGNSLWDDATRIVSGTYSGTLPVFIMSGGNASEANVFTLTGTAPLPAGAVIAADTTPIVRVAVPEPAALAMLIEVMLVIFFRRCALVS